MYADSRSKPGHISRSTEDHLSIARRGDRRRNCRQRSRANNGTDGARRAGA